MLLLPAPAGLLFTQHKRVTLCTRPSARLGGEDRRGPQAPTAAGLAGETDGLGLCGGFQMKRALERKVPLGDTVLEPGLSLGRRNHAV